MTYEIYYGNFPFKHLYEKSLFGNSCSLQNLVTVISSEMYGRYLSVNRTVLMPQFCPALSK